MIRYMVVEYPKEKGPQRREMEEERPTSRNVGQDGYFVSPPTEVQLDEDFLDVQEYATLHEEGLNPLDH